MNALKIKCHLIYSLLIISTNVFAFRNYDANKTIEANIFNGNIYNAKKFTKSKNRNLLYKAEVYDHKRRERRDVLVKPRKNGDGGGYARNTMEYTTYKINELLCMDYIPPTAYRFDLNSHTCGSTQGSIQHFVENAHELWKVDQSKWLGDHRITNKIDVDLLASDMRVLDVLIQNSDRHKNNIMRGKHWADGKYRPIFIDHAAAFRKGAKVTMTKSGTLVGEDGIQIIRKRTFNCLIHKLNKKAIYSLVFLKDHERKSLYNRRNEIINYFNTLIQKYGKENVVINL